MATFPVLKTGAAAQYPLDRGVRFSTQAVRFMDGSFGNDSACTGRGCGGGR